jgi:hypothetical protein
MTKLPLFRPIAEIHPGTGSVRISWSCRMLTISMVPIRNGMAIEKPVSSLATVAAIAASGYGLMADPGRMKVLIGTRRARVSWRRAEATRKATMYWPDRDRWTERRTVAECLASQSSVFEPWASAGEEAEKRVVDLVGVCPADVVRAALDGDQAEVLDEIW